MLSLAIYVRSIDKQQQFYTDRGKWRIAFPHDIDYVIRGFTSPESLDPLLPYFPGSAAQLSHHMQSSIEGGVPRPLGGPLLVKMQKLVDDMLRFYRENSSRLDNFYPEVADDYDKREYTLAELASKALGVEKEELNDIALFVVHWAARRHKFIIEPDRSSLSSDHYLVQQRRMAERIDLVLKWIHEHQEHLVMQTKYGPEYEFPHHPMEVFIQKARRLIQHSRRQRSPTLMASVGPTAQKPTPGADGATVLFKDAPDLTFNGNQLRIVQFLLHYCIPPRQMTSGPLRSAGSYIMRATGMYDTVDVNAATMPLFLQEIGVVSPWENLRLLDQRLALPGHAVSVRSEQMWEDVVNECEKASSGLADSMEGMRTDWGDLSVYCVDSPGAQEIDDGVSLERVPGSEDTFWVRVHVANPSAFVAPDHPIAKYAAHRYQSLYAPERTYPMLPKDFTHTHFSLAPGRPALTFSAKMNLRGEVLDTDITNGTVRNVVYATHDMLRELFGVNAEDATDRLQVGGELTREEKPKALEETLSATDKDNFRILRKLLLGFREYRRENGAIEFPVTNNNPVTVDCGKPLPLYRIDWSQPRFPVGDPIIHLPILRVDPHEVPDQSKRYLISITMNIACWVAGKWCADRNIPAVYDGTWYHPEYPKLTNETFKEIGGDGWRKFAPPKGTSSAEPIHHVSLGLPAYVKTTSPLRRYVDMLAHYQIEAALRFERTHNRRFDGSNPEDQAALPFSKAAVEEYIARSKWKANTLKEISRSSRQFWACLLLFRAFYFGEGDLPDTFRVLLQKPYSHTSLISSEFKDGYMGVLSDLGVKCQVNVPKGFGEVDVLSLVEAEITEVNMARMMVIVEPVRLIKKYERFGEWA